MAVLALAIGCHGRARIDYIGRKVVAARKNPPHCDFGLRSGHGITASYEAEREALPHKGLRTQTWG